MSQRAHTLPLGTVVVNQKNRTVYWAYNGHLRAALKESN